MWNGLVDVNAWLTVGRPFVAFVLPLVSMMVGLAVVMLVGNLLVHLFYPEHGAVDVTVVDRRQGDPLVPPGSGGRG